MSIIDDDRTKAKWNTNDSDNNCILCCKNVEIYSIGACNHPICYECSTRLRVLCKNNECPMCRKNMQNVYFSKSMKTYEELAKCYIKENLFDDAHGIYYSTSLVKGRVDFFFSRKCQICTGVSWKYKTNEKLEQHLMREHGLYHCSVCARHLKLFAFERKCYTESELARHNREGDPDDTSYRGHSLCKFCSKYFFDKDDLFVHLRRDHFRCHLCNENDGKEPFYSTRAHLYEHFEQDHYLCNKGECRNDQLVSVFATKAELNSHLETVHRNKVEIVNEEVISKQFSFRRELGESSASTSTGNLIPSIQESYSDQIYKKNASKAYHIPQLSQQSRDNFFRQFGSASIPIGTSTSSKKRNKKQPNAETNRILTNAGQAGGSGFSSRTKQVKQESCSKAYPLLKLSQNSRDNFFKQFESAQSVPEVTTALSSFSIGGLPFPTTRRKIEPKKTPKTDNLEVTEPGSASAMKPKALETKKMTPPKKKPFQRPQLSQSSRERFFQQFAGVAPAQPASEQVAQSVPSAKKESDVGTTNGKKKKVKWTKL